MKLSTARNFTAIFTLLASALGAAGQRDADPSAPAGEANARRLEALKQDVIAEVEARSRLAQQMVDSIFSFSELGFQEFETMRYVTEILEREGFSVERGVAGIPTAWVARWGSGKPVISLGTDVDGLPRTNQKPGVITRDELVPGAPGHGEGHNAGQALIVTAALAVKAIMERENIPGTLMLWPGIAEEQLAGKAYFARAGLFDEVDAVLFAHVGNRLSARWGDTNITGLVSVEYEFTGETAHGASPWSGRSALDAVELMNVGWNVRREHLGLSQRSHYVITEGGDQPNVVPDRAAVWYFLRETNYERIMNLWSIADRIAQGAALMTDTTVESRVLGAAWPQHGNRPLAELMHANIQKVGMPDWSEADQQFARAFQRARGAPERGLSTDVPETLEGRELIPESEKTGGASDDIGDVMWVAPTARMNFPSNVPGGTGHHWSAGVAMATPVAHKGAVQGAKVQAMTVLDLLLTPELVAAARDYFENVQGKQRKYQPIIRPEDEPPIWLNRDTMDRFRPELKKYYYDPTRYDSYLEQLGIPYPPAMPPAP